MIEKTTRQAEVFEFIKEFQIKNRQSPSMEDIRKHFKWASKQSAQSHIDHLRNKGYIETFRGRICFLPTL